MNLFNAASLQALKVFQSSGKLAPNTGARPGTAAYVNNNYIIANGSNVQPVNKLSVKGDHLFNEKHRISGYYGYDRESTVPGPEGPATLPGVYSNYNDTQQDSDVVRFSWDWTLSSTKFNHFYAGGNNWRQNHNPPQEYIGNWKDKFCLHNVPDCNDNLVQLFSIQGPATPIRHGAARRITVLKIRFTPITTTSPGSKAHTLSSSAASYRSTTTTALGASAKPVASASALPKPACRRSTVESGRQCVRFVPAGLCGLAARSIRSALSGSSSRTSPALSKTIGKSRGSSC